MGRKKRPPDDDKKQSAQFKETAERIEGDNEIFEKACKAILKPPHQKKKPIRERSG